jgi:hypothetical protein
MNKTKPNGGGAPGTGQDRIGAAEAPARYLTEKQMVRDYPPRRATLRNWRRHGGGPPFIKCGRSIYYDRRDVEDWFAAHKMAQLPKNQGDDVAQGPMN